MAHLKSTPQKANNAKNSENGLAENNDKLSLIIILIAVVALFLLTQIFF